MVVMAVTLSPTRSFSASSTYLHSYHSLTSQTHSHFYKTPILYQTLIPKALKPPTLSCYHSKTTTTTPSFTTPDSDAEEEEDDERESNLFPAIMASNVGGVAPPVLKKRKRYRKEYPGESNGITEEMRFVAMKLRNDKGSRVSAPADEGKSDDSDGSWEPSIEGFIKYLVDSKLVFQTLERVVEDSNDVSYAYFRKTGLERSEGLARDLEWFGQQGVAIPQPSNPGVSYASYLKEIGEKSAPLFLSHFYNVYFSHIAGGQVVARQVADKLLTGRELEFYRWDGDAEELLKEVRLRLNRLGEHWTRDDKNKCLKEATKSFRHLGQIVRLIIL